MRKIFFVTILFLISNLVTAHDENVHTYISKEAYKVLILQLNQQITQLQGQFKYRSERGYFPEHSIMGGAYYEDAKDIVYGQYNTPEWLITITHFWHADFGDDYRNSFGKASVIGGPYENAYTKVIRYAYPSPGEYIKIPFGSLEGNNLNYTSLTHFYKTGECILNGQSTTINSGYSKNIALHILGRMAHLLQDMTVPAHVHLDEHGSCLNLDDIYEQEYINKSQNFKRYNLNTVNGFVQPFAAPSVGEPKEAPLHFLMYTTNQITDYFKCRVRDCAKTSSGSWSNVYADNEIKGSYSQREYNYLINILSSSQFLSNDKEDNASIADNLMPLAIKATAGLFYWFYQEANLNTHSLETFTRSYAQGPYEITVDPMKFQQDTPANYTASNNGTGFYKNYTWEKKHVGSSQWEFVPSDGEELKLFLRIGNYTDFQLRYTATDEITGITRTSTPIYITVKLGSSDPFKQASEDNQDKKVEITEEMKSASIFNYPNPFNPSTNIEYSIKENSKVKIVVYNMLGQEIATLIDEEKSAGTYLATFDASGLPSGMYYCKIYSKNFYKTIKMLLTK